MKAEILIEVDYESYGQVVALVHSINSIVEADKLDVKQVTISFIDSGDKVFMTESSSPNGE